MLVLLNGNKAECFQTEMNSTDQRLLRDKLVAPQKYEQFVKLYLPGYEFQQLSFLNFTAIVKMSVVPRAKSEV